MRTVERKVYYCDFCRKHGLQRAAMEKHERHCTLNPDRKCRWQMGEDAHAEVNFRELAEEIRRRAPLGAEDVDWLRDATQCPACMLAVFRQAGVEYHYDQAGTGRLWDYGEEVERFRKDERVAQELSEHYF